MVFSDGTDRARRNTLAEVQTAVTNTNVFALMSVYITGEVGVEASEFLDVAGRDGSFQANSGAGQVGFILDSVASAVQCPGLTCGRGRQVNQLNAAFKAIAWQLSAKVRRCAADCLRALSAGWC